MHRTVFLADADFSFREAFAHQMKNNGFTIVGEGENGVSTLWNILYTMPGIVVLDTELFGDEIGDVIRIIRQSLSPSTKIILVAFPKNASFITAALGAGADNCILKPCHPEEAAAMISALFENSACENVKDVGAPLHRDENTDRFTDIRITRLLQMVGIPVNISGYFYLSTAIRITLDSPKLLLSVTKKLYPAIANVYGTKSTCVERSIRHAIEKLWYDRQFAEEIQKLLGYDPGEKDIKPTNSEFIALAVRKIQLSES